jgi:predicted hydrocarbon binding protein
MEVLSGLVVASGKSGFVMDAEKGEAVEHFGEISRRMVFIASEAFVKMMEALNVFGTAAFTMLYMMGQEKGRYDALKEIEVFRQRGVPFVKIQVLENIVRQLRLTGWGVPKIQKYNEKQVELIIMVENNPLVVSLGMDKKSDGPICHYFRGYWVGVVSEVFERKISCVETKCMGSEDPYCEFKITSAE